MSLPNIATLASYGGALVDYQQPLDPTTDRPASAVNPAYADTSAMTHTAFRAWARFRWDTTLTPTCVLVAHDAVWGNGPALAPTLARLSAGVFTVTWPATVADEIPSGQPGASPARTVALRGGRGNSRGSAVLYHCTVSTVANVLTLHVFDSTGLANDAANVDFDVFVL